VHFVEQGCKEGAVVCETLREEATVHFVEQGCKEGAVVNVE